jgi:MIP family channel proteins
MFNSKVFVAELIGTFALVFIGASSTIYSGGQDLVMVALGYGLTLAVFMYAFGHISGTHVNPAVTFGLALQGVVSWGKAAVSYWIPQFVGAIGAAFMLKTFIDPLSPEAFKGMASVGALNEAFPYHAMGLEVLLTFFLVNAYLHLSVNGKGGSFSGLAIGSTLAIAVLAGGPLTGASLNPARTFGPAVFTGTWNDPMTYMIYFLGPLFGATLAVLIYQFLTKDDEVFEEVDDLDDEEEIIEN